jgi:nitrate reductase NapE component
MSNSAESDDPHPVERVIRTVTPLPSGRRDTEMDAIGLALFLGLVLLFLPLLPWLVVGWAIVKLLELLRGPPGEAT